MLERWPGYNEQSWAERFAELDRRFSKEQDTAVKAICQLSSITSARITELETALAEAEGRVIADVVKWLRGQAQAGDKALLQAVEGSQLRRDLAAGVVAINRAATALETGERKK